MITEDTRIDYERIGEIDEPSVSSVLLSLFGSEFCHAMQHERLVLMEAIAFSLRVGGAFSENLCAIRSGVNLPQAIFTRAEVERNEGLKLLAVLQVAIVEGYSVALTTKQ
jgi:hypothetical protein